MADPIRYRGHGRYEAYYPAVSVVGVMGHELIHMAHFRRKAAQEGHVILQSGVRLSLRLEGGLVVAGGGEAYVRSRPARDADLSVPGDGAPREQQAQPRPQGASPPLSADGGTASPRALISREQRRIQQALQQLRPFGVDGGSEAAGPLPPGGGQAAATAAAEVSGVQARRAQELERRLQQIAVRLALAQAVPPEELQLQALLAQARRAYQQAARDARPAVAGWPGAFG